MICKLFAPALHQAMLIESARRAVNAKAQSLVQVVGAVTLGQANGLVVHRNGLGVVGTPHKASKCRDPDKLVLAEVGVRDASRSFRC